MSPKLFNLKFIILLQLFICFWQMPVSIMAQEYQYFNKRLDLNGQGEIDRSRNIVEVEDGYVIAGYSIIYSGNLYWWEKVFAKIDKEGEIQIEKHYGEDSVDYFFPNSSRYLIKNNDHFYAVGKIKIPTLNGYHDQGTLMYLNENLDTLWMKRYCEIVEPFDTSYLFTCLQKITENEIIIAGARMPDGIVTHAYLLKVDSLGQYIWDKSYNYYGEYIEAYGIAKTTDDGFIIGCVNYLLGDNHSINPVIIKTDSLGNRDWQINLGSEFMDNKATVCLSNDSMIIVGTNYADSMYTPDIAYSKINIIKLDNLGNIIWNKRYGPSMPNNYLLNIKILNDNSILSVGSIRKYDPKPDWVGWILKTKSNGDSIWYREYNILPGQQSLNYLYDIIPTSDSGLIACGYIEPYPPDTGSTDTWVIKLDSIGCEWAGCDTTVGIEEDKTIGRYDSKTGGLEVWPNPASGEIHVRLNMDDGRFYRDLTLVIYDIFGRMAPTPALPQPGEGDGFSWQIDISALPPGIYLAVVKDGQMVLASAKFMVVR